MFFIFHLQDGNAQEDGNDQGLDDIAFGEGGNHIGGKQILQEPGKGDVHAAGDFFGGQSGKVGKMARLQDGSDCQPYDTGQDGGDDIVGDDPAADPFQGSQIVLGDDPCYDGADHHGDDDHFDAVQPDIPDEAQLDHGFSAD